MCHAMDKGMTDRHTETRDRPTQTHAQTHSRDTHADTVPKKKRLTARLLGPPPHEAQFHTAHHEVIV
jgi:hypothetical protein